MQFTIKWKRKPKKEMPDGALGYPFLSELMNSVPDEVMTAKGWMSYKVHQGIGVSSGVNRTFVRYGGYETERDTMKKEKAKQDA